MHAFNGCTRCCTYSTYLRSSYRILQIPRISHRSYLPSLLDVNINICRHVDWYTWLKYTPICITIFIHSNYHSKILWFIFMVDTKKIENIRYECIFSSVFYMLIRDVYILKNLSMLFLNSMRNIFGLTLKLNSNVHKIRISR